MATLAQMNENLGLKRRELAAIVETQKANYEAIDSLESQIDALSAKAEKTEAEVAELAKLQASHSEKAKDARNTTLRATALQNDINALQASIDERASFEALVQSTSQAARQPLVPATAGERLRVEVQPPTAEQISLDLGYLVQAKFIAARDKVSLKAVLSGSEGYEEFRNDRLQAATTSNNAPLVPVNYARTLIELLRPQTVIRSLTGVRNIPLVNGNVTIPRQASSSTASWNGEVVNIAPSTVTSDSVTLTAKKLGILVPVSGELMRRSDPAIAAMLRDDLVATAARAQDVAFLRNATAGAPIGLQAIIDGWNSAANRVDATAAASLTPALATADLGRLQLRLANGNTPMGNRFWIFTPRTEQFLMDMRDANGNLVFAEMARGVLKGIPYRTTTQIPDNLTIAALSSRTNCSEIYLVEATELLIGDTPTMDLQVSDTAAYWDGSAVQSTFSRDQAVARLIMETDFNVRHQVSVAYMRGVNWGA